MITGIQHVAILTHDIEQAIDRFCDLIGCERKDPAQVDKPGVRLRTVMLPLNPGSKTFLQLIEPQEGPGVEELRKGGEGAIFEIGFETDDIEQFNEHLGQRDITPTDLAGGALPGKFITSKFGNRYFIVQPDDTEGTRLEFVQVM